VYGVGGSGAPPHFAYGVGGSGAPPHFAYGVGGSGAPPHAVNVGCRLPEEAFTVRFFTPIAATKAANVRTTTASHFCMILLPPEGILLRWQYSRSRYPVSKWRRICAQTVNSRASPGFWASLTYLLPLAGYAYPRILSRVRGYLRVNTIDAFVLFPPSVSSKSRCIFKRFPSSSAGCPPRCTETENSSRGLLCLQTAAGNQLFLAIPAPFLDTPKRPSYHR
jgi:hypothetical protein